MPAVVVAYLTCSMIWGTTWFAIRVCIGPGGYPTLVALALRFSIASLALLPFAVRARAWPRDRRVWFYLVLAGVLDSGGYLLVYFGEEKVTGGVAAVVYGTQPLLVGILLTLVKIERLTRAQVIGSVVSLAGVAVLFLDRLDVSMQQAIGVALVFGSVFLATIYSAIMKQHGAGVPPIVSTTVFITVTAVLLVVIALIAHERVPWPPPPKPTLALFYLGLLGSAVAFFTYFWLMGKTSLIVASTLVFVYPLVAMATDALFERAMTLGPRAYLGAAITLCGLAVSFRKR